MQSKNLVKEFFNPDGFDQHICHEPTGAEDDHTRIPLDAQRQPGAVFC